MGRLERRRRRQKRERQKAVSEVSDMERKGDRFCEVSVSHSGGVEDSILLGYSRFQSNVTSQKT